MKIVVLSFDQLSMSWLGTYGNQWLPTPNFDRLALHSTIFDRCYAESVNLENSSHAWWDGGFRNLNGDTKSSVSLAQILKQQGVDLTLLVEGDVEEHSVPLDQNGDWKSTGEGENGTLDELIEQGIQSIEQSKSGTSQLIWLKGLGEVSNEIPDIRFIEQFAEEEGLEPTDEMLTEWLVIMSQPELFEQLEPDQQQDLEQIFGAARILEIDAHLGKLWDALLDQSETGNPETDNEEWRLVITAATGEATPTLSTRHVSVPMVIGTPACDDARRRPALVSSQDLPVTLIEWLVPADRKEVALEEFAAMGTALQDVIEDPQHNVRDFVCFSGAGEEFGLATRHYLFLAQWSTTINTSDEESWKLYVLPDDGANRINMARQYLEVAETLSEQLTAFVHQIENEIQPGIEFFQVSTLSNR
ncbi:hypothetical protein Pla110_14070 [Polystyrenella longa]|uniref:Sulfatase n=1 Tax=Polystyrenella longa TaxID=2528007 RepID=A0A518CKE0_9PLAN|nr:hypothetical protein [Polystyrenella longa]QDU79693.1 hypothetical protein Pla110_14070 [Polystyrenella longa]